MKAASILILALSPALYGCNCAQSKKIDNTPIDKLDLVRYLGTWYEIARYDHYFERNMSFTAAKYSLKDNGKVRVENSGWINSKYKKSVGKAYQPEPATEPARLRVSFFGPFYSDYRVLMLTPDYKYALIGSKSAKYLWILSRDPQVPDEVLDAIITEAQRRGYDTDKLLWVKQDW